LVIVGVAGVVMNDGAVSAFVVDIETDVVFKLGAATVVQTLEIKGIGIKDIYVIPFHYKTFYKPDSFSIRAHQCSTAA